MSSAARGGWGKSGVISTTPLELCSLGSSKNPPSRRGRFILYFGAKKEPKKHPPPPRPPPIWGGCNTDYRRDRDNPLFWYRGTRDGVFNGCARRWWKIKNLLNRLNLNYFKERLGYFNGTVVRYDKSRKMSFRQPSTISR